MIARLIWAEYLKLKRKGFWLLTFVWPLGVVALQMVNYGLRKEYLLKQSEDHWAFYLDNVNHFTPLAVILGMAIFTSYLSSIEDETQSWKEVLSLPVSKGSVYLSKALVLLFFFTCSSLLLMVFTLGYGLFLDLGKEIPYGELIKLSSYPYLAAFPIFAIQLWLAVVCANQATPLTVGIFGVILVSVAPFLPDWVIWKWPSLRNDWNQPSINVLLGLGVGGVLYFASLWDFARREVK